MEEFTDVTGGIVKAGGLILTCLVVATMLPLVLGGGTSMESERMVSSVVQVDLSTTLKLRHTPTPDAEANEEDAVPFANLFAEMEVVDGATRRSRAYEPSTLEWSTAYLPHSDTIRPFSAAKVASTKSNLFFVSRTWSSFAWDAMMSC